MAEHDAGHVHRRTSCRRSDVRVQVAAADPVARHLEQDVAWARLRLGDFFDPDVTRPVIDGRPHRRDSG